ncbi:hypothetical protein [Bryobacter aggregatus]|uniref:hypothetical protein n=1 Tax=Bryobacter aggregatus TaxID=360054 RepID=UPI0004E22188|nr:hypothetical protein [Bryobacter aggregatus]
MRERFVALGLITVLAVAITTELLSAVHWIGRPAIAIVWAAILALWTMGLRGVKWDFSWEWIPVAGIWAIEGFTALVSPPNSSDAMAYHMPRVVIWIQQHSVEFFATPYLNQIMLQPLHEYLLLHFQLLSGGDRLANCVAWLSTGGYLIAVSLLARNLGAGTRGQALAAFCAATLPNGIMQGSGVKNEALLSFLLITMVSYALSGRKWAVATACGLACLTKGTAFLFCGPLVLLLIPRAIPHVALLVLLINGPFFWRNYDLSGSPLGFDSAQADGRYRWRNEYLSWQPLASNLMRHLSEQMGSGSQRWNDGVYAMTLQAHEALGLQASDPAMTWRGEKYAAPRRTLHETDSANGWHLALLVGAAIYLAWKQDKRALLILGAMAMGTAAFCFYLKWQPFMSRMWLPLFSLGMALVGVSLARMHWLVQVSICLLFLSGARLMLFKNWVRPLRGPENMFQFTREDLYYNDMKPWNVRKQYDETMQQLRASSCRDLAMDINIFQLEYPIQALLLKEHPDTRFVHVNTTNPSKKYEARMDAVKPCLLVCLACDRWVETIPAPPRP